MGKRLPVVLLLIGLVLASLAASPAEAQSSELGIGCVVSPQVTSTDRNNPDVMTIPYNAQLYSYIGDVSVVVGDPIPDQELYPYGSTPFYNNQSSLKVYTTTPGSRFQICDDTTPSPTPIENTSIPDPGGQLGPYCVPSPQVLSVDPNNPTVMSIPSNTVLYSYVGTVYVVLGSPIPDQELYPYGSTPFYQSQTTISVYTTATGSRFQICEDTTTPTVTPTSIPGGVVTGCTTVYPVNFLSTDYWADLSYFNSPSPQSGYWMSVPAGYYMTFQQTGGSGGFAVYAIDDDGGNFRFQTVTPFNRSMAQNIAIVASLGLGAQVQVCLFPEATPTPTQTPTFIATATGTRSPTATWTPQPNCYDVSSDSYNIITLSNFSVLYYGQKQIRVISSATVFVNIGGSPGGNWQNGETRIPPAGTYNLGATSTAPFTFRICTSLSTTTPTTTGTPTATGSPTSTPTATPTSTPGVAGCVGQLYTVPGTPAQTTIALQRDQQFVIADTSVTVYLSVTLTLAPGAYRWNLPTDSYIMSGADGTAARLLLCVAEQPPQLTGTLAPCSCAAVTAIAAPTARRGSLVDLSVPLPTLLPLTAAPITSTVTISATVVIRAIQTVQAGISTPAAAIGTQTAGYTWESGAELSASWATPIAPALEWFSVINPQAPAWSADGGPLWALAPLLLPILPIIGVGLVVVAIRFYIWVMAWILKLIDVVFKLIELIPGE